MIEKYEETGALIVAPLYKERRGNPVLLDMSLKGELTKIQGDIGAREIVKKLRDKTYTVEVDTPTVIMDINTEKNIKRLKRFREVKLEE